MDHQRFDNASQKTSSAFKKNHQFVVSQFSLKDELNLGSELAYLEIESLPGSDFSASKAFGPRFWDGLNKLHSEKHDEDVDSKCTLIYQI